MLAPGNRALLTDLLQPPEGYVLDEAVGLTYSLDILALVAVPLTLASFEWEDAEAARQNPELLLHALRGCSDRVSIFCQQTRIASPGQASPLAGLLEPMVHEVRAPNSAAVFHPKCWVLRFVRDRAVMPAEAVEDVQYRLLCLSRNLTFDNSWDVVLRLDGTLTTRKRAFRPYLAVGELLGALPAMSVHSLDAATVARVERLAREVQRVEFELPDGAAEAWSHANGLGDPDFLEALPSRAKQGLVISPFVDQGLLRRLLDRVGTLRLVSRADELARLDRSLLRRCEGVYVLADQPVTEDETPTAPHTSGLHAKVFAFDEGHRASLFVGSANATTAAFERNVELLLELRGRRVDMGCDAIFSGTRDGGGGLECLLRPFDLDAEPVAVDQELEDATAALEAVRDAMADLPIACHVRDSATNGWNRLVLECGEASIPFPEGVELTAWPITRPAQSAVSICAWPVDLGEVPQAEITSFIAFEVHSNVEQVPDLRFVMNLPLVGAPAGRREAILRSVLQDPEKLMRFLLFLLSGDDTWRWGEGTAAGTGMIGNWGAGGTQSLLEPMLRALHRHPHRLDAVNGILQDLEGDSEEPLLPPGFQRMWDPIWGARQHLRARGAQ